MHSGHIVTKQYLHNGVCYHCRRPLVHDPSCVVALALDRRQRDLERALKEQPVTERQLPKFAAVGRSVMRGQEHIATAVSSTMAQRIARALNAHKPNSRGV